MDRRVTSPKQVTSPPLVAPSRQICKTVVESLTYFLFLTLCINKVYHRRQFE